MHAIERLCVAVRHHPFLARADWLWNHARPAYERLVELVAPKGLTRRINGTDPIRVLPRWRSVPECYEPDVWAHLCGHLRLDDVFVDVGAFIGLYAVAAARRVRRVVAFEPDPENFEALEAHVALNGVSDRVERVQAAVSAQDGVIRFDPGKGSESRISSGAGAQTRCVRLDSVVNRSDILKIDVEGYEEMVLRGAAGLLDDPARAPRLIYIEVHPYAWGETGTSAESLQESLTGYRLEHIDGSPLDGITRWGHIVAVRL